MYLCVSLFLISMNLYYFSKTKSSPTLSCSSLVVGANVTSIRDPMGHARFCGKFGVLLELLAGEI